MAGKPKPPPIVLGDDRALWERQEGEGSRPYADFLAYRDFGPERSLAKVSQKVGKCLRYVTVLCKRFRWVARVEAWDTEQDRIREEAAKKGLAKATEKQALELELSGNRTLLEAARLAFSQLTQAAEWDQDGLRLRDSKDLDPATAAAISEVSLTYSKDGTLQPKIKMHPKTQMIQKLGEHFKLWDGDGGGNQQNWIMVFIQALQSGALKDQAALAEQKWGPIEWEDE